MHNIMQQYSYQPRIEETYLILQDQWQYLPSPSIVELLHDDMELHVSKNKHTKPIRNAKASYTINCTNMGVVLIDKRLCQAK